MTAKIKYIIYGLLIVGINFMFINWTEPAEPEDTNDDEWIETQITTDGSDQLYPAIYGDKIVWYDDRNGNWDIYMYDLLTSTETQITDNSDQFFSVIYGDRIIWQDYRNGNHDIYMYDLLTSTETPITTNSFTQQFPAMHGDKIVWYDNRNGNNDIYMSACGL